MEAHGSPAAVAAQKCVLMLPKAIEQQPMTTASVDRLQGMRTAMDGVRRSGTVSLLGVYAGLLHSPPPPRRTRSSAPAHQSKGAD